MTDDLIRRQDAIKAVHEQRMEAIGRIPEAFNAGIDTSASALEKIPSAQRWIPCSERLPNHDECIKNNGLFNVSDGDRSYSEWYDNDKRRFGEPTMSGFRVDYAVIAWMPLPEPCEVEK